MIFYAIYFVIYADEIAKIAEHRRLGLDEKTRVVGVSEAKVTEMTRVMYLAWFLELCLVAWGIARAVQCNPTTGGKALAVLGAVVMPEVYLIQSYIRESMAKSRGEPYCMSAPAAETSKREATRYMRK